MFYHPDKKDHGLAHDPFKAIVAPRPIGWVSSLSKEGLPNLAPYSFFNGVGSNPDMVAFSSTSLKDSAMNIRDNGEFVCNYVSQALLEAMNMSSASVGSEVNEFELANLEQVESRLVSPPRVKGTPAALECKLCDFTQLKSASGELTQNYLIIGEVIGVYIDDAVLTDGRFDYEKAKPVTRMGYLDYQQNGEKFELKRPSLK